MTAENRITPSKAFSIAILSATDLTCSDLVSKQNLLFEDAVPTTQIYMQPAPISFFLKTANGSAAQGQVPLK